MSSRTADTDYPIHNTLAVRWSPYAFSSEPVPASDLRSLFEAARWAPSYRNEQPWRYIVGIKGRDTTHARIVECLAADERTWAGNAPVLTIGVVLRTFAASGQPNRAAEHDLGLASANLMVEATARKLFVRQTIDIDSDAARAAFAIPENAQALTVLAIGYHQVGATAADPALRAREAQPRTRRPLTDCVFSDRFGKKPDF